MKNIFLLLFILVALASCSKDDVDPANEKYRLKEAKFSEGTSTKYEYDAQGKLLKYTSNNYNVAYSYDSQGRLISMQQNRPDTYEYYYEHYAYANTGNLEEKITRYKDITYPTEIKYRDAYYFNGTKLTEIKNYYWNTSTSQWYPPSVAKYEYNSDGKSIKFSRESGFSIYSYDTNGNRKDIKEYQLKSGSTSQFYLRRSSTYTFDDKKNIFDFIYPDPTNSYTNNPNNYIDITTKDFDETGATINVYSSTTTYEYNSAGYPIKALYNGGYSTTYILEKY